MAIKDCLRKLERAGYRISDKMRALLDEGLRDGLSDEDATRRAILNSYQNVVDIADRARREGATLAPVANPISDLVQFQSRALSTLAEEKQAISDEQAELADRITDVNALEGHLRTRSVKGLSPIDIDKAGDIVYVDLNNDRQVLDALLQMKFATDKERRQAFGLKGVSANEMLASFRQMQADRLEMQDRLDELEKKMNKLDERVGVIFSGKQQTLYQSAPNKLVVQHNLTAENLLKTDELGGLAVPSLAVMKEGMNIEGFGEIALIGTQELADPKNVPILDADGYTVRFQTPEYSPAKVKDRDALWKEVLPYTYKWEPMGTLGYYMDKHLRDHPNPQGMVWQMQTSYAVRAYYLESVLGENLEPTIKDVKPQYKWGWDDEIVEFFTNDDNMAAVNLQWENPKRIEMLKRAGEVVEAVVRRSIAQRLGLSEDHSRVGVGVAYTAMLNTDGTISEVAFNRLRHDAKRKGTQEIDSTATANMLENRLSRDPKVKIAFNSWVENKVTSIMGEPFLKIGNKKVPYNLENIVRKMKGKLRGTEGFFSGMLTEGMMRALVSHRFKRLEEMRARAEMVIGESKDVIDDLRVEIQAEMNRWTGEMSAFYDHTDSSGYVDGLEVLDAARHAIIKWATSGRDLATVNDFEEALIAQGFSNLPEWILDEGMIIAMDFLAVPVPYFEAKPQRAVMLEEFAGAVIPSDLDAESRAVFLKRGIPMKEYQVGDNIDASVAKAQATAEFTQQLNNQGERTLFQRDIGLTSGLLTAARVMPQEKGPAEQMLATLMKQPNVKKGEMDAVGVEEWAYAMGEFTRDQLVEFISNNGVQIEETYYQGQDDPPTAGNLEAIEVPAEWYGEGVEAYEPRILNYNGGSTFTIIYDRDAGNVYAINDNTGEQLEIEEERNNQSLSDADKAIDKFLAEEHFANMEGGLGYPASGQTRWAGGSWTLTEPYRGTFGDQGMPINHREIVLHTPTVMLPPITRDDVTVAAPDMTGQWRNTPQRINYEVEDYFFFDVSYPMPFGRAGTISTDSKSVKTISLRKKDFKDKDAAVDWIVENMQSGRNDARNYKSHAFPQDNIIAWMRVSDRMGANGEKIFFIEETQSDLHQAGLTGGYTYTLEERDAAIAAADRAAVKAGEVIKRNEWFGYDTIKEVLSAFRLGDLKLDAIEVSKKDRAIIKEFIDRRTFADKAQLDMAVPNMPWKGDAWAELAMKRIIRLAVEGGYDQVAWTSGMQQMQRYDLSEYFDHITWDPRDEMLVTYDENDQMINSVHQTFDELEGAIGAARQAEIKQKIDQARSKYDIFPVLTQRDLPSDGSIPEDVIVLEDDDPFIGSYERQWLNSGMAYAVTDSNGELIRESSGNYQMAEYYEGAVEVLDDFAFGQDLPTLRSVDMADEETSGLKKRYDELLVNVTNRALRKIDKKTKVKRLGLQMEGGDAPWKSRVESDGDTYYVSGLDPSKAEDVTTRIQISPRFQSYAEAHDWNTRAWTGYGNVQHGFDITPEIKVAAMEGQTLFQDKRPGAPAGARGSITWDKQNRAIIRLTEAKDLSTFLHEAGHLYLEMMGDLAERPGASKRLIDDYTRTLKYLGVNKRSEIGVDQHELFARSFEAYLREGVAPTAELQDTFTSFKGWLTRIYSHIRRLMNNDEELTDDMRGVFDRLIASDEAISQSEDMMAYVQLYQTAEEMGVSQEVFNVYKRGIQEAHDAAVDRESKKMLKAMNRSQQQWWKDELATITKLVRAEAEKEPIFIAMQLLMYGQRPNGEKHARPFKLSKESVLQIVGSQEFLKRLPRPYVYTREGGVDADVAAGMFGYADGKALISALVNAPKMEDYIKSESLRRMNEANPDPYNSPQMIESATEAVHDTKRSKILAAELRALRKQQREDKAIVKATKDEAKREDRQALDANRGQMPKRESMAQIKAAAELLIAGKQIRNINPNSFLQAERKAGRLAFNAMAKKDYAEAYKQKLAQIMHYQAYRAALKAKAQAARDRKYLQTFDKKAKRQRMGRGGQLEKIDAILESINMQMLSSTKIDKINLEKELLSAMDDGTLVIPPAVLASMTHPDGKNWRELTFEELSGIRDVVKQLEHQAKRELEVIVNGEKIIVKEAVDDVVGSIISNNDIVPIPMDEATAGEAAKLSVAKGVGHWLRSSSIARVLDKSGFGAVTRRIIVPIRRAYTEKLIPRQHAAQEAIAKLYKKHYSNDEMTQLHKRTGDNSVGEPMSKAAIISLGLNWGSESNREAVLNGVRIDAFGNEEIVWNQESVAAALATLDARDWAFIQDIWDYENSFYDEMAETEKRRRGIAPKKIESLPFEITTSDGEVVNIKGGYHPLQYDQRHGSKKSVTEQEFQDFFNKVTNGTYLSTSTRAGATYERTKNHGKVVRLSLNVIDLNTRELIRDLTIGDEVNLVNRILTSKDVANAANNTGNAHLIQELKLWLSDAAVGELPAQSVVEKMLSWIRVGFTKSKLAFNLYVTMLQLTGATQSMAVIGSRAYGRGFMKFLGNPVDNYKMVMDKSKFMQARYGVLQTWDKDVSDTSNYLKSILGPAPTKFNVGMDKMAHYYFYPIAKFQSVVDVTTWMGAYEKALNDPNVKSEPDAVMYADSMVENAQTSGLFSDRSGLERGTLGTRSRQGQFIRLWTTLISYMLAKGNIAYEKGVATNFRKPSEVVGFATDMALLFLVEGILSNLLYGRRPGDEDEDETLVGWTAGVTVDSVISTVPLVREFSQAKYGGGNTPVGALFNDAYTLMEQQAQGDVDEAYIKAGVKVTGTLFHLPASQVNRAVDAMFKEGDAAWYEYLLGAKEE